MKTILSVFIGRSKNHKNLLSNGIILKNVSILTSTKTKSVEVDFIIGGSVLRQGNVNLLKSSAMFTKWRKNERRKVYTGEVDCV